MRAKISLSWTSKLTADSARRPPKSMERSSTVSSATPGLFRLEPVRERLEPSLLDADPESLRLRLVVGADRHRGQDAAALEALHALEGGDEAVARQRLAGAPGRLREEH